MHKTPSNNAPKCFRKLPVHRNERGELIAWLPWRLKMPALKPTMRANARESNMCKQQKVLDFKMNSKKRGPISKMFEMMEVAMALKCPKKASPSTMATLG